MKFEKIKKALQGLLNEFNSVITDKGKLVFDDELKEGVQVMLVDEEGNETSPEDGEYYLGDDDGRTIVVEAGVVKEIRTKSADEIAEEQAQEEAPEEMEETPEEAEETTDVVEEIAEEVQEVVEEVAEEVAEDENTTLRNRIAELEALVEELNAKITELEGKPAEVPAAEKYRKAKSVISNDDEKFNNLMRYCKK